MEGLLARGTRALAEASNLMGYKNAQQDLSQWWAATLFTFLIMDALRLVRLVMVNFGQMSEH